MKIPGPSLFLMRMGLAFTAIHAALGDAQLAFAQPHEDPRDIEIKSPDGVTIENGSFEGQELKNNFDGGICFGISVVNTHLGSAQSKQLYFVPNGAGLFPRSK